MSRGRKVGSAYPQTTLNRWFAVLSGLFFFSTMWMFWDDYARPWKDYQRQFIRMQRERAEAELLSTATRPDPKKLKQAKAAEKTAKGKIDKQLAKLEELKAERHTLEAEYFPADQQYKFAKATVDTYRYQYDFASGQLKKYRRAGAPQAKLDKLAAEVAEAAAKLSEKVARFHELKLAAQKIDAKLTAKNAEIGAIEGALAEARKSLTMLTQKRSQLQERLAGLQSDWVFHVRNAPMLDFLAPNLKVNQVVLPDLTININFAKIQTVDRCMTCHVAIDKPGWEQTVRRVDPGTYLALKERYGDDLTLPAELTSKKDWSETASYSREQLAAKLGETGQVRIVKGKKAGSPIAARKTAKGNSSALRKAFKNSKTVKAQVRAGYAVSHPSEHPYSTHPDVSIYTGSLSPHPMGVFGCRSCHNGLGRATDFYRAVHMPDDEETEKRWVSQYNWHQMKDMYWNRPMYPKSYTEAGCVQCHGSMVELEPMPWARVGENPGGDAPYAGQKIFESQSSFVEHGCNGCHKVDTLLEEPKAGPGLNNLAVKLDQDWVRKWIENPKAFRKHTRMPQVFKVPHHMKGLKEQPTTADDLGTFLALNDLGKTPGTEGTKIVERYLKDKKYATRAGYYGAIMDVEMAAIVTTLFENSGEITLETPKNGDVAKGKQLFLDKGCLGCHKMDDYPLEGEKDKRFGPDLSNVADKLNPATAEPWLYTWLLNPKTYHANSKMPDVRLEKDEAAHLAAYLKSKATGADDKKAWDGIKTPAVDRDLVEMRLVNFLEGNMSTRQAWRVVRALRDDGVKTPSKAQMVWLGEKVIGKQGCFGCHEMSTGNLEGLVKDKKEAWELLGKRGQALARSANFNTMAGIGVELSDWGNKYLSKLEFGLQKHIKQTHWEFAKHKIHEPRKYDLGMYKGYDDMLRMPWFGFDEATAKSLATYVTGLKKRELRAKYDYLRSDRNWKTRVWETQRRNGTASWSNKDVSEWTQGDRANFAGAVGRLEGYSGPTGSRSTKRLLERVSDKISKDKPENPTNDEAANIWVLTQQYEGSLAEQWMSPSDRRRAIVAGRKLIRRHNCRGCHQIEGRGGELGQYIKKHGKGFQGNWEQSSPPWLDDQGERTKPAWLFRFLRDPHAAVGGDGTMRRWLTMRMPKYHFSVEEANVLTRYFAAVSGVAYPSADSSGTPSKADREALQKLYENTVDGNCLKCHGDKPEAGQPAAPDLELAGPRLREAWIERWLMAPHSYLPYTQMVDTSVRRDNQFVDGARARARQYARALLDPATVRKITRAVEDKKKKK